MLNWGDWYFRACGPWLTLCVEGSAGTMKFWQNLSMTTTALQPRQLANWPAQWCNLIVGICCFCHVYKNSPFFILQNSKPFRSHKAERLQEEKLEESFQNKKRRNFKTPMTWRITIDPPEEQSAQSQNSLAYDSPRVVNPWQNISDF